RRGAGAGGSPARGHGADAARRAGDLRGGGRAQLGASAMTTSGGRVRASAASEGDAAKSTRLMIASVVDQVYLAIRERIADGALARGARIHQEDLAEELGVSRP